jgi:tetratricopeptide (TPR) repeat protein
VSELQTSGPATSPGDRRRALLLAAGLVAVVGVVYAQVASFGFVNIDDQVYVTENPHVLRGLTADGLRWALGFHAANWHPLTWLSHMLDVQLFGLRAGGHHLTSALLHLANTLLVFRLLRTATGAVGRSALVAALFGVHPLHVESVAWVAERKDVLSTLFGLLAALTYVHAVRRPGRPRLWPVAALLALGLMAKPMLVPLPLLLLLLDLWPLGRLGEAAARRVVTRQALVARIREKAPLLVLSAASAVVTALAQAEGGAVAALTAVPLLGRVENAVVSLAAYLRDAAVPVGLASFYPHPAIVLGGVPVLDVASSIALLIALAVVAVQQVRARPWIAFGLAWYAVSVFAVLGLVQVGEQARADRYTYLPLVGVFVAVVWGAAEILERTRRRWAGPAIGGLAVAACAALAVPQAATWRNSVALHERAVAVTERNWKAWQGLCDARSDAGDQAGALAACGEALRIAPAMAEAWNGFGVATGRLGRHDEAIAHFRQAIRSRPGYADAWYNLGTAYGTLGRHADAVPCFREALRLRPDDPRAWFNLAVASLALGDRGEALDIARRLQGLDPGRAAALARLLGSR